jgi:hypothetical protein
MRAVDNLFATKNLFRALSAYLQAMVTEAIHQGAVTALVAAQL